MPHGDFSDASALFFAVTGAATVFAPQLYFAKASFLEVHPMLEIHPMLETEPTPELLNARATPRSACSISHAAASHAPSATCTRSPLPRVHLLCVTPGLPTQLASLRQPAANPTLTLTLTLTLPLTTDRPNLTLSPP